MPIKTFSFSSKFTQNFSLSDLISPVTATKAQSGLPTGKGIGCVEFTPRNHLGKQQVSTLSNFNSHMTAFRFNLNKFICTHACIWYLESYLHTHFFTLLHSITSQLPDTSVFILRGLSMSCLCNYFLLIKILSVLFPKYLPVLIFPLSLWLILPNFF